MKQLKGLFCYSYIILWMMYYLQGMFMIKGAMAQAILALLILMSFYAFFQVNMYYRTGAYLRWLNVMLLIVTIYGLVLFFSGFALYPSEYNINTSQQFGYLQKNYMSVLPVYAFYLFSLKDDLSERYMKYVFGAFLFFTILLYYQNFFLVTGNIEKDEITNNMGYRFVPLIPMLALFKMKDIWKYLLLMFIFAFIMMSMKRGAILVGTVAFLLYLKHHLKANSSKQFFYILLLSAVAICFIYFFVMNLYETSDYFRSRLSSTMEGNTSRRSEIYSHYFDFFIHQTTSMEFLFGCGANATYLKLGEYAHNDWLEMAINQGVIFGVIPYIIYWVCFIGEWRTYKGARSNQQTLGDTIIIYFLVSLFSMSFNNMPIAATMCIGYSLANNYSFKRKCFGGNIKNEKKDYLPD